MSILFMMIATALYLTITESGILAALKPRRRTCPRICRESYINRHA